MESVGGILHSRNAVWRYVTKSKPFAKMPGGRIRLSTADELSHSLEAQNKPTLHWVSEIGLRTS